MASAHVSVKTTPKALKALKEITKATRQLQWAVIEEAICQMRDRVKADKN